MKVRVTPLVVAIAVVFHPTPSRAQIGPPQRPANGLLFEQRGPEPRQHLDVVFSPAEGYDSTGAQWEEFAALGGVRPEPSGAVTILTTAVDYSWRGQRGRLHAQANSNVRRYGQPGQLTYSSKGSANHLGAIGFVVGSRKTTLVANQTASYSDAAVPNLFPAAGPPALGDAAPASSVYASNDFRLSSFGSDVKLIHSGRRNGLSIGGVYQYSSTSGGIVAALPARTVQVYGSEMQFTRRVTRNTQLLVGHLFRNGNGYNVAVAPARMTVEHELQSGVEYRHPFSATRSLMVRARLGMSTMMLPAGSLTAQSSSRRFERLTGDTTFDVAIARSWHVGVAYRQGFEYLVGLAEPVSARSGGATVDGLLSRRADLLVSTAYSNGESALNAGRSAFDTYSANVRLRFALTRVWAISVDGLSYLYAARGAGALVTGLPPRLERRSLAAGFVLRLPVIER